MSVDHDVDLEEVIGDDAFGRTTPEREDWLRTPAMRFQVRSTLRLMIASMEDQLRSRAHVTTGWRESTERYLSRLRVSLVEFDGLCDEQDSIYRKAIERHKAAVLGDEDRGWHDKVDIDLWSVLG